MDSRATALLWNYKQKSYEVFVTLMLLIILNFCCTYLNIFCFVGDILCTEQIPWVFL